MANSSGKGTTSPRRLGGQQPPVAQSSGAKRRQARAKKRSNSRVGWIAVAVVVVVIGALIIVKATSSNSPTNTNSPTVDASGQHPPLAPAAMVDPVTSVPSAVFDSVGVNNQSASLVVTKNQPFLRAAGKPRFVYVGGEFCPYCAAMRWSIVAALSRFGTFHGLKETSSSPTDGNIPTFSFLGATYSSPYLTFTPYEQTDRLKQPLQPVPADVQKLYTTYDGTSTGVGTIFSAGGAGIPFLDIANQFTSAGDPPFLSSYFNNGTGPLVNGGPGSVAIAQAIHNPSSAVGQAIGANGFIVEANYIAAAICSVDGNKPASVCNSPGVKSAASAFAKATPIG